jgi:cob(I)alamin adenosyltransferase
MVAQLQTDSTNTLVASCHPAPIKILRTIPERFATEIVADALRIASTGKKVLIVQLLKGGIRQGQENIVNLVQNLDWIRCNLIRNVIESDLNQLEYHNFQQLWKHTQKVSCTGEYDLVIIDGLILALNLNLIDADSTIAFLSNVSPNLSLILTGNNIPTTITDLPNITTLDRL